MEKQTAHKLKVAFIGGGINSAAGLAHFSAINIDNVFELVSGYFSRYKNTNFETAQYYKIVKNRVYNDIDTFIEYEKRAIDAVILLTPTDQHHKQVIKLIENNIPVICEKALGSSKYEIAEIEKVIEKKNGFLSVIYNYLGYPIIRELKHIIQSGKLGEIKHIQIEMPQEGFARINKDDKPIVPQDWRLKDNVVPTISLDLAVHLHMFIKYLVNEKPLRVVAKSESLGNFSSVIDNVNSIIEYSNDITCNMWYSKVAMGQRNGLKLRIYGKKGAAEWIQEDPEMLYIADNKGNRYTIDRGNADVEISNKMRYTRFKAGHPAGFVEAFANYYTDIANALHTYKNEGKVVLDDCFGINEAKEGIMLLEAIQKSSQTKKWETILYN